MKPMPIGIIGGAGPRAGVLLMDRVLSLSCELFGCYKDADFPQVVLLSFPFSEMLSEGFDAAHLQNELKTCLEQLRQNGASILAIACNTLHAFLMEEITDLIHLPRNVKDEVAPEETPLVLCTSTSRRMGIYEEYFPSIYPNLKVQGEVDRLIDQVLRGGNDWSIAKSLLKIIQTQAASTIILGCTELSLYTKQLQFSGRKIIDPLEIAAKKIVEKSFLNRC